MSIMKKSDVQHLATLARLDLTDEELEKYAKELTDILGYVDQLKDVETDESGRIESAGVRNVFREDGEPHETGIYTDDLLKSAPNTQDGFVKVKPILNQVQDDK